jgi:hypothetical protein
MPISPCAIGTGLAYCCLFVPARGRRLPLRSYLNNLTHARLPPGHTAPPRRFQTSGSPHWTRRGGALMILSEIAYEDVTEVEHKGGCDPRLDSLWCVCSGGLRFGHQRRTRCDELTRGKRSGNGGRYACGAQGTCLSALSLCSTPARSNSSIDSLPLKRLNCEDAAPTAERALGLAQGLWQEAADRAGQEAAQAREEAQGQVSRPA